jgi:hypothetical protein
MAVVALEVKPRQALAGGRVLVTSGVMPRSTARRISPSIRLISSIRFDARPRQEPVGPARPSPHLDRCGDRPRRRRGIGAAHWARVKAVTLGIIAPQQDRDCCQAGE